MKSIVSKITGFGCIIIGGYATKLIIRDVTINSIPWLFVSAGTVVGGILLLNTPKNGEEK